MIAQKKKKQQKRFEKQKKFIIKSYPLYVAVSLRRINFRYGVDMLFFAWRVATQPDEEFRKRKKRKGTFLF